jgi:hypothetical protein
MRARAHGPQDASLRSSPRSVPRARAGSGGSDERSCAHARGATTRTAVRCTPGVVLYAVCLHAKLPRADGRVRRLDGYARVALGLRRPYTIQHTAGTPHTSHCAALHCYPRGRSRAVLPCCERMCAGHAGTAPPQIESAQHQGEAEPHKINHSERTRLFPWPIRRRRLQPHEPARPAAGPRHAPCRMCMARAMVNVRVPEPPAARHARSARACASPRSRQARLSRADARLALQRPRVLARPKGSWSAHYRFRSIAIAPSHSIAKPCFAAP